MIEKEDRTAMTVYFPKTIWGILNQRIRITGRSKTEEVIHLIKLGLRYGQEADVRALSRLMTHLPEDIEQL